MNKNLKKCILAVGILTTTCACSLPFQSSKYPAWSTNGIIDYEKVNGKLNLNCYKKGASYDNR